jgi:oligoribonuclease (3'-5' exoribonuclease)
MVFIDGTCPDCGWHESDTEKESRQRELKIQAGELQELSFDIIETLIQQRNNAMMTMSDFSKTLGNRGFADAAKNSYANRQYSLSILRHWIQEWCTRHQAQTGQTVALVQLDFELTFGINIFKAQTGTASAMTELAARIQHKFNEVK